MLSVKVNIWNKTSMVYGAVEYGEVIVSRTKDYIFVCSR